MTNNINGIDVSDLVLTATNNDVYYSQKAVDELQNNIKRLQEENEKIKKQYNCYACGNCNGKEDYINLEKHHKGLRKQFDELVKRNNTLSLRIEELEKENEELKKKKDEYYLKTLDYEAKISYLIQALEEIREIAKFNQFYNPEKLLINGDIGQIQNLKMTEIYNKINEVLNDRD